MQQRKRRPLRPQKVSDTCPKCGYCDKCGRSNAAPVWPWPVVYPAPYVTPTPYQPYWRPTTTTPWLTNVTVSGTSTAAEPAPFNPTVTTWNGPVSTNEAKIDVNDPRLTFTNTAN